MQNMLFNRAPLWDSTCTDLNSLCYNSVTEHGQMLGVAIACGRFWQFFILSIYCPFGTENWLYSVELIEAGDTVDSKNRQ